MSDWGWPQWVLAALLVLRFVGGLSLHGKPKEGEYNAGENAFFCLLWSWLLWAGGFWS